MFVCARVRARVNCVEIRFQPNDDVSKTERFDLSGLCAAIFAAKKNIIKLYYSAAVINKFGRRASADRLMKRKRLFRFRLENLIKKTILFKTLFEEQ